jgi:hypothetical protein
MDPIISVSTLLVLCILAFTAFIVYSVTTIRKLGVVAYFKRIGQLGKATAGAFTKLIASLTGLLAASAQTSSASDEKESDITGVYNFRTRKFDNGTDPYGWYEEDL